MPNGYPQKRPAAYIFICVILCFPLTQIIGQEKGVDAFKSYQLNKKHRKVKLTDLIQEVEFIRLEETPESLLGNLYDVHAVGLVTEVSSRNWPFRGGSSLEEIVSSENPVLVRIKVKDFSKD